MFNVYNARLFSKETQVSRWFHNILVGTGGIKLEPPLSLWPCFLNHVDLKRGEGYRHRNYTRFAIEIPLEGNLIGEQRGQTDLVSPGEVYLIHYGEDSSWQVGPAGFCRKIGVGFAGPLFPALLSANRLIEHLKLKLHDPDRFLELILELERKLNHIDSQKPSEAFLTDLSVFSFRIITELAFSIDTRLPVLLQRAVEIMKANLSQMLTVAEIADKLETSSATLGCLFREHLHSSPGRYFADLRMRHARELLAGTELPVSRIAANVGYVHLMHFSRRFTAVNGVSPVKYRELSKKKSVLSKKVKK